MLMVPRAVCMLVILFFLAALFSPLQKLQQLAHCAFHELLGDINVFDLVCWVHLNRVSDLPHALLALNADLREVWLGKPKQIHREGRGWLSRFVQHFLVWQMHRRIAFDFIGAWADADFELISLRNHPCLEILQVSTIEQFWCVLLQGPIQTTLIAVVLRLVRHFTGRGDRGGEWVVRFVIILGDNSVILLTLNTAIAWLSLPHLWLLGNNHVVLIVNWVEAGYFSRSDSRFNLFFLGAGTYGVWSCSLLSEGQLSGVLLATSSTVMKRRVATLALLEL